MLGLVLACSPKVSAFNKEELLAAAITGQVYVTGEARASLLDGLPC